MATLTPTLTLAGTAVDFGAALSLSETDALSVTSPSVGVSRITITTAGGDSVIVPSVDSAKYVYIKHTGLNSAGEDSGTDKVRVESADDVTIAELSSEEFMFFPYYGSAACAIQLEASANTVQVDYAYWTRS